MTQRRLIATGILVLWVGALGLLAKKQLFPGEEKRRASVALLVEPVSYYYAVERDGQLAGYASSQVDTSVLAIRLRNAILTQQAGEADSTRISTQYAAHLTPQLRLRDFEVVSGRTPDKREIIATSVGDSAIQIKRRRGPREPADTVPFSRGAVTPEIAPMVLALGRKLKVGDEHFIDIFDRETSTLARAKIRIDAESLFTVTDSARMDSTTGRFVGARTDTVRAWRAEFPGEGGGLTWFDRSGRVVVQQLPGGLTLRRTAFELSFENWRLNRDGPPGGTTPPLPGGATVVIPPPPR